MIEESAILQETAKYAQKILNEKLPKEFVYHSLEHTKDVVNAAKEIGEGSGLSDAELEVVVIAAWFHDLGYCESMDEHEKVGTDLAVKFLTEHDFPEEKTRQVIGCIMATKMPQSPKNLLEEVLCDADLIHLSSSEYCDKAEKLKEELAFSKGLELSNKLWWSMNLDFFEKQEYFTEYAKENYAKGKTKNLELAKDKLKQYKKKKVKNPEHSEGKTQKTGRGVETMFRLTSKNHLDLSNMADNKANIMISINSIILSVIVSVLIRKLEEYPHLIAPTMIMTVVCLTTIVFAILATRPNVSEGRFTRQDILNKKTNLLFFGNFHSMSLQDYEWGMKEMIKDPDYVYSSLIRDIYFLGAVLGKKYKMLRIAYTFFMFGFVFAVLSFILAEVFLKSQYSY
ncbi:Pycsar system effector family protein [Reichenbachiella sp. MALMAid0571]|uniref:Pycsar system effector family protein n=1 Tax=Reichenbachiella sp. MALMAid0571 TaxID=3143939 RepID=UPI0032DF0314